MLRWRNWRFKYEGVQNRALKLWVKIRFIPPSLFLSGICFSDVFSDYKTFFSSMAFLSEMHNKRDTIF